jgi:DNA-binding transcriptional ArsR family regulator
MAGTIPDAALDLMADRFRLLGDSTRLAILRALMAGEKNVGQIVSETGRGQANISKHLKLMSDAGMLARRKDGLLVHYRVADPMIEQLCDLVCRSLRDSSDAEVKRHQALRAALG